MNVLLLGGAGQLGSEIRHRWNANVVAPTRAELDIGRAFDISRALDRYRPDAVVNCAAFHNVDACEREPREAFAANALAVDHLARACASLDIAFTTVSTDYVFDGEAGRAYVESDIPWPVQTYGVSKLAGEYLAINNNARAYVIRTCGIFGRRPSTTKGYTFVDRIINQARAGEEIRVVADVYASPTYAGHLAEAMEQIVQRGEPGIYHVANVGPVSWYDFAVEALRQAGIDHPITPISAGDWKAGARRPRFSALASEKLPALGIEMPSWQEGIAAYLRERDQAD